MRYKLLLSFFVMLLACSVHPPHAKGEEGKRLVIINSYHDGAPWAQEIANPIITYMSKREDFLAAEVVYLNNTLIHNALDYAKMEAGLFERFSDKTPDYLVLIGNFAFTLRDRIVEEWGDVPMLLVGQSDQYGPKDFYYTEPQGDSLMCTRLRPLAELHDKYNFSLVYAPNLYEQTIDMMVYMFPDMNHLIFAADQLYLNRYLNFQIKRYINNKYPHIQYEWLEATDENGKLLQQVLNDKDLKTEILLSTWYVERMTIHGYPQLIAGDARTISSVKRPVFGLRYAYFSYGITGGYFVSPEEFRQDIFDGLFDLIGGKCMSDVPFRQVTSSFPIIDYEKLIQNKIPRTSCPPDTQYINQPKTLWEQHYISILIGGVVFLAVIIVTLVLLIYQRRRIELLRDRERMVGNMPIGYSQATLRRDAKGKVLDVDYHGSNDMFKTLLEKNEHPERPSKLFDNDYITAFVERLLKEDNTLRFSHHFDQTDTDYEFLASVNRKRDPGTEELDIFAVDITDQKKKEQMLIEAREKAMESDKLKMAFLANMSHEIRTPLNAIVGFSTLLTKTNDPEKKARFVNIIEHNNELLLKLISDVLDTAKIESNTLDIHKEPTDINSLLQAAESTVRLRLPKNVALNLVLGAPDCVVVTDSERVNQVLVNLLINAIKFTESGFITVGYDIREDDIYFYVRDSGQGIAPEDLSKLFTRFTKLNNFVQGTGLGLSISKSIVERLGGKIGAESAGKGRGSLFWFTIPRK